MAKCFSTFRTACTPVNVIASFTNAGIVSRLNHQRIPTGYIDADICRCSLQNFYGTSIEKPSEINSRNDERFTDAADRDIDPVLWLKILDEETARLIDSDE
jgi:hypothetical protein